MNTLRAAADRHKQYEHLVYVGIHWHMHWRVYCVYVFSNPCHDIMLEK